MTTNLYNLQLDGVNPEELGPNHVTMTENGWFRSISVARFGVPCRSGSNSLSNRSKEVTLSKNDQDISGQVIETVKEFGRCYSSLIVPAQYPHSKIGHRVSQIRSYVLQPIKKVGL